jgi:uncharacterized protein
MPGGLVALLDDVAALAKLAATSVDDVAGAAGRTGTKIAGVVIDDTAVTPKYVSGLTPDRELPIIYKITKGSLKNKLFFLLPIAIALSELAPWLITPLLMVGGAYLCFEATEKIWHSLTGSPHDEDVCEIDDPAELEERQVGGAIRTDFILSAEIMAIALAQLPELSLFMRVAALALVAIGVTVGVYGTVGLIVKMDDVGLHLCKRKHPIAAKLGGFLVHAMPLLLTALSLIGTAAMLWVGGGIVSHGLEELHIAEVIPHTIHEIAAAAGAAVPAVRGVVEWATGALGAAVVGIVVGGVIVTALHLLPRKAKPA